MSEEYHRLQDAARDVEREISELEQNHGVNSAAELAPWNAGWMFSQ